MKLEIKCFDRADESRVFEKGRFDVIHAPGLTLGRASYAPGWKWSEHVGPTVGSSLCHVEHVGLVLSGRCKIAMSDGRELEIGSGDIFVVPAGHDSWVVGDEPYVSLHFIGTEEYAKKG